MPPVTLINDPLFIKRAYDLKLSGMFVSDIAKMLSHETGTRITQIALWRALNNYDSLENEELNDYEYPSLEDISYLFNKKVQKEKNSTVISYRSETIRRDLMLKILNKFYKKEFTCNEVKRECNDRQGDENFLAHWKYLLDNHYIEKVDDIRFKFCDRIKKWKAFGQI